MRERSFEARGLAVRVLKRVQGWIFCWFAVLAGLPVAPVMYGQAATGTLLEGGTLYPRVARLGHGPAETKGRLIASTNGVIFESKDDGRTWSKLGLVPTAAGSKERCCATLFEMPHSPELEAVQNEYLRLAASLWAGTEPCDGRAMRDRDIFDFLGFD